MNSPLIKALQTIEAGKESSLLCELPQDLLKDVNVSEDGSVGTDSLLKLCQKVMEAQDLAEEEAQLNKDAMRKQFLMKMIYDGSIAVNPAPKAA